MPTFEVEVEYLSKFCVTVDCGTAAEAGTAAMVRLKETDAEAGPVEVIVRQNGEVVSERRVWGRPTRTESQDKRHKR